jgi:hypothetical protein
MKYMYLEHVHIHCSGVEKRTHKDSIPGWESGENMRLEEQKAEGV